MSAPTGHPVFSAEATRIIAAGPPWREHPAYYADPPECPVRHDCDNLPDGRVCQDCPERCVSLDAD